MERSDDDRCGQPPELHREQRLTMAKLLVQNPNYFGTHPEVELPVVQPIKLDTAYEELTCVGMWPERQLLEATIVVKQPFGFLGNLCQAGSHEYVRFFIDWNGDGDFSDPGDDIGVASISVHDIPQVAKHRLCYAVSQRFTPRLASCKEPYLVKLRAILSWNVVPTGPGFIPIWGNIHECWVQVDPVKGAVIGVVAGAELAAAKPAQRPPAPAKERAQFIELLDKNPNYFGTVAGSPLKAVLPQHGDTSYEELKCIGLYPERNFLEGIIEIKRPFGYLGDLCSGGSKEYVRFFIDWNGDGDFVDFSEDAGVAAVAVHDIAEVGKVHLCYALGRTFEARHASCQAPYIVKVRAILSWQQVPTGPSFIPVWGNVLECWVQIRPNRRIPPVLVGQIDAPLASSCPSAELVAACALGGAPLLGFRITGSAGGVPFDHYRLRYSWGANPPIDSAVVYPDCSRPPAAHSASTPVIAGTLGYLDATLLPPGETSFTVYLDVFDTATATIAVTRSFSIRTVAVELSEIATVKALEAEDPFHPGTFTRLIKATSDPSPAVPELSVGGAFSVTGSAYVVGCNRILSQYVVTRFAAPPAAAVPDFPDATGGAPLIAPVAYDDSPAHPWQSGCLFALTPNTILNGNLIAFWSTQPCTFLGAPYTVPKVQKLPFWNSAALNGRFALLVEARDRLLPAGPFPGDFAAKDQVAVWIDNRSPIGELHSIGNVVGCGDLKLSDFAGSLAEIRGVAWDPPIDASAPQLRPNDNFGSYALAFQKNGAPLASGGIPVATPGVRVPNVWAASLPAGAAGTLASWDIVGALDGGAGPLPANSPKLLRGTRCAYVVILTVSDTTHVGDSGDVHSTGPILYAVNVINDL
jgi:hypothetical protein